MGNKIHNTWTSLNDNKEERDMSNSSNPAYVQKIHKQSNYAIISNTISRDLRISNAAKGLLITMLGLPSEWKYCVEGLVKICKDGRKAIQTQLKELEDNYYLYREKLTPDQTETRTIQYIYHIYEIPYVCKYLEDGTIIDTRTGVIVEKGFLSLSPTTEPKQNRVLFDQTDQNMEDLLEKSLFTFMLQTQHFEGDFNQLKEQLPQEFHTLNNREFSKLLNKTKQNLVTNKNIVIANRHSNKGTKLVIDFAVNLEKKINEKDESAKSAIYKGDESRTPKGHAHSSLVGEKVTNQEPQKCLLKSACSEVSALKEHNIIIDNNKIEKKEKKSKKDYFKEYKEKNDEKNEFYSSPQDLLGTEQTSKASFSDLIKKDNLEVNEEVDGIKMKSNGFNELDMLNLENLEQYAPSTTDTEEFEEVPLFEDVNLEALNLYGCDNTMSSSNNKEKMLTFRDVTKKKKVNKSKSKIIQMNTEIQKEINSHTEVSTSATKKKKTETIYERLENQPFKTKQQKELFDYIVNRYEYDIHTLKVTSVKAKVIHKLMRFSTKIAEYTDNSELRVLLLDYFEQKLDRNSKFKHCEYNFEDLDKLAGIDDQLKIDIVKQSLANGYIGLFPVKNTNIGTAAERLAALPF